MMEKVGESWCRGAAGARSHGCIHIHHFPQSSFPIQFFLHVGLGWAGSRSDRAHPLQTQALELVFVLQRENLRKVVLRVRGREDRGRELERALGASVLATLLLCPDKEPVIGRQILCPITSGTDVYQR